ncbi:MAG: MBL fold metallo-hydrolase [Nitrospiraceae bacterium]|nr:MBL fold metallo-hydrolase [Nitrospiraceae bacterium]
MPVSENSVITIDCHYLRPKHSAAYLLVEDGQALFIENSTVHAVPLLLEALEQAGLRRDQVRYAIITHLHLDHAGGTSALVRECPNATVLAHPRATRHLVDPERLIAGVKAVYGDEEFERLYAPILPIDERRVRAMADSETLAFGQRTLTFLHTLGHAKHHMCIHDSGSNSVFTGDSFGIYYLAERRSERPFLLCSSAPTDFDPEQARASVRRIMATGAQRLYPTHFGALDDVAGAGEVLLEAIDRVDGVLTRAIASDLTGDTLLRFCEDGVREAQDALVASCGAQFDEEERQILDEEAHINAQGLAFAAEKRMAEQAG